MPIPARQIKAAVIQHAHDRRDGAKLQKELEHEAEILEHHAARVAHQTDRQVKRKLAPCSLRDQASRQTTADRMQLKLGYRPLEAEQQAPVGASPRQEIELTTGDDDCAHCGGTLRRLGEDVTEELEYVPGRFIVNRIVRPRLACSSCEAFTQTPMPSRPIERGRPGPGLLAHVLVSKYADHLPFL